LPLRKLVPALYRRHLAGQIVAGSRVLGGRQDQPKRETYLAQIEETCRKYLAPEEFSLNAGSRSRRSMDYLTLTHASTGFQELSASLAAGTMSFASFSLSTGAPAFSH